MLRRSLALGAAMLVTVFAGRSAADGSDTFQLGGLGGDARAMTLGGKGDADSVLVWSRGGGRGWNSGWRGGGWNNGWRGGGWGWNRGWRGGWGWNNGWRGGWGWNNGWRGGWGWNNGWRGGWGWNNGWRGGWGWNNGWGWSPGWGGWGWGNNWVSPGWGWGNNWVSPVWGWGSWNGCSGIGSGDGLFQTIEMWPSTQQDFSSNTIGNPRPGIAPSTGAPYSSAQRRPGGYDAQAPRSDLLPMPTQMPRGTYRYDGGPQNPVPMPKADPPPAWKPAVSAPADGKVVSLKPKPTKFTYPAYGETPQWRTTPDAPVIRVVQQRSR